MSVKTGVWVRLRVTLVSAIAGFIASGCGGGGGGSSSNTVTSPASTAAQASAPATNAGLTLDPTLTPLENLGKFIMTDVNLSEPAGTPCVACHQPGHGFADNNGSAIGVAMGSQPGSLGLRNALANAYSSQSPAFGFTTQNGRTTARGGQFWDGRVDTLAEQALLPLLNPTEMNNASAQAVINKIAAAPYASLFLQQFGTSALSTPTTAFTQVGLAVQAFEQSAQLQAFTSKFDAVVQGQASFTALEQQGLNLFTDRTRANCASCHTVNPGSTNPASSLFTDFTYRDTGVPRNQAIPQNAVATFFDLGLCGPQRTAPTLPSNVAPGVTISDFCGQFKVPSLRNVGLRSNFMHNGFFTDLGQVVHFYSTRVSNPSLWYGPSGVPNDVPSQYLANVVTGTPPFVGHAGLPPLLTAQEEAAIVAFLNTLTDGFTP